MQVQYIAQSFNTILVVPDVGPVSPETIMSPRFYKIIVNVVLLFAFVGGKL